MDRKTRPGGIKSREGLPSNRLWPFPSRAPIQISRVRTHAEATNTAREGANHGRRPKLSVPICPLIGAADGAAWRAIGLDEGEQRAAWDLIRREVPWLMESDRALVEIAASIRARVMAGEEVGVSALNQLRMCMAQMGATPADRSKVAVPDEPEGDPADRFFN